MATICVHALVTGRVQGVWFRQSTLEEAERAGLVGWVRNLPDGSVEVMLQGEEKAVHHVEAWLGQGPELATVADVQSEAVDLSEDLVAFSII